MEYLVTETGRFIAYTEGGLIPAVDIARMLGEEIIKIGLTAIPMVF